MDLVWNRKDSFLLAGEKKIQCWSEVKNELNHKRPSGPDDTNVFYTSPFPGEAAVPAMPRPFPIGEWKVTKIKAYPDWIKDAYTHPYYFGTDAWQWLDEWALDDGGRYLEPTGRKVRDTAYGFHYSVSYTTLGCIRIATINDLLWLYANVKVGDRLTVKEE